MCVGVCPSLLDGETISHVEACKEVCVCVFYFVVCVRVSALNTSVSFLFPVALVPLAELSRHFVLYPHSTASHTFLFFSFSRSCFRLACS